MASIRDTLTKLLASDKPEPGTPLARAVGQYPFQQGEAPLEAPMLSPDDLIGTGIGKAAVVAGSKYAPLLMGMIKNPSLEKLTISKALENTKPFHVPESEQPFIGYFHNNGAHETFNHDAAKAVDYHHSNLMKNPDAYFDDNALSFVRMGGENVFTVKGNSILDPYEKKSSEHLGNLAKHLISNGADPKAPFYVENLALPKIEAPYQGKEIGSLEHWLKYSK